jgi:hypothetical protein
MTITNGYATLAEFLKRYGLSGTDTDRDATAEAIIQAVSRVIDNYCGRAFYASSAHTARVFTAADWWTVFIDDLATLDTSGVKTDEDADGTYETTWATTDFVTCPENASIITWLETTANGSHTFPLQRNGVQVTGTWGHTLADPVKEACYLQSWRLFLRKTAPFGVAGSAEMGQSVVIPKLDPDVAMLLDAYKRGV